MTKCVAGKCWCAHGCPDGCELALEEAPQKPFKCRGMTFRDEDDAYDYFRQREIDG